GSTRRLKSDRQTKIDTANSSSAAASNPRRKVGDGAAGALPVGCTAGPTGRGVNGLAPIYLLAPTSVPRRGQHPDSRRVCSDRDARPNPVLGPTRRRIHTDIWGRLAVDGYTAHSRLSRGSSG